MHVKAKKIAIGGLMLAFSIVSMLLGNILEVFRHDDWRVDCRSDWLIYL
ncbi:Uncharacterised protein [Dorea longicatena]|nr:Uncharacterised protein [Dorea longicatena]